MQNVKIKQPGIRSWIKGGISISVNSDISVVAYALTSLIIISSIIIQTVFSPGPILVSAYQGNPVISWNKLTTEIILQHSMPPPRIARAYALVHISIYDVLLTSKNLEINTSPGLERAIITSAASEVLSYLFQDKINKIKKFALSQGILERNHDVDKLNLSSAIQLGQTVGKQVVMYAKKDGSNSVFNGTVPTGDCKWKGTNPLEPMAGQWNTFVLSSGAEIQPPPPETCNSEKYKTQVQQVVDASHNRTTKQIEAIHYWGDKPPPIIWNSIFDESIKRHNLSIIDTARALAYLNIGMYDAGISTWYTKFNYWTERPFQAAPSIITEISTPNFPGYTSGHSTFSGTAKIILGEVFPDQKEYFDYQADEANMSRMWGGIHLLQDCEEGLAVGIKIGNMVLEDMRSTPHTFIYK
jgi:hypothetical protein